MKSASFPENVQDVLDLFLNQNLHYGVMEVDHLYWERKPDLAIGHMLQHEPEICPYLDNVDDLEGQFTDGRFGQVCEVFHQATFVEISHATIPPEISYNQYIRQSAQNGRPGGLKELNDELHMNPLTDDERDLLTRLAQSPMLVSRTGPLGRRFMLEELNQRGLVRATAYQQSGIIYSLTQAGQKAITDD